MSRYKHYDMESKKELMQCTKALASMERLEILELLYGKNMIIGDIARELQLPVSSTAFHLKILEQAGLIRIEEQPGTRGNTKLCISNAAHLTIDLVKRNTAIREVFSAEMPVGAYSSCRVTPTCGLWSREGRIGLDDAEYCFYYPERMHAGMVWSSSGYLEYKFANGVPKNRDVKKVSLSMEVCSEAPGYKEDWKSDITIWINGVDCGTFTSPGDFGSRRGRLNPPSYSGGKTQYGLQVIWEVTGEGAFVNGERGANTTIRQLKLEEQSFIAVRIGNKPEARYVGGFTLFGKGFGDYDQDLILTVEY